MARKIQQVFRDHFDTHRAWHRYSLRELKAASALCACRTSALGGHVQRCPEGHVERVWYNSCRHRSCPQCAYVQTERWIERQQAKLIDSDYFHVIFTIDDSLNELWAYNRDLFLKLLFRAAWGSMKELLADPKYLGAEPGALGAFHSWGQTLWTHPHVHMLVTGGGLSPEGRWCGAKKGFLLPSRVLSAKFRGKFLAYLRGAIVKEELALPPSRSPQQWLNLLNRLGRKKWHVMIQPPYRHGRGVVRYLGRYMCGGAVSDRRISYGGEAVTLRYKDNKEAVPKKKTMILEPQEFMRRVLLHVPPPGVHTMRAWGLFAHGKREALNRARALRGQLPVEEPEETTWQEVCARSGDWHPERCPVCRKLLLAGPVFRRGADPPPSARSVA